MTLQYAPPGLDYERDKKFSKSFKQMIASCLVKDPLKRPSARKLIKHSFFKQARSNDYIVRTLLDGLPSLGDRITALKKKEQDMLAQKKMADGEKEELSQNEYKRGISGWNFNLEDLKLQASLIQDDELFEKDHGEENESTSHSLTGASSSADSNAKCTKYDKSEDDGSITTSTSDKCTTQYGLPRQTESSEINTSTTPQIEGHQMTGENRSLPLHHRRATSSACAYTLEIPLTIAQSFRSPKHQENTSTAETLSMDGTEDTTSEPTPRTLKASPANSEEMEAKLHVIQQKGRFKVTSGNVDIEKATPSHASLQKSQSLQVIAPVSMTSLSSPVSAQTFSHSTRSLFSLLESFLQTNITQRESILSMMKQIASGDINVDGVSTCTSLIEKSLLESAHDKEKELMQEITALQWRLINAQEELQKLKADSSHVNN